MFHLDKRGLLVRRSAGVRQVAGTTGEQTATTAGWRGGVVGSKYWVVGSHVPEQREGF